MSHSADLGESNVVLPMFDVGDGARSFIMDRGGILYLRVRQSRCCSGAMTFLDASCSPRGEGSFLPSNTEGIEIRLHDAGVGFPRRITVEVRGRVRPHLVAFWDGCAYRL